MVRKRCLVEETVARDTEVVTARRAAAAAEREYAIARGEVSLPAGPFPPTLRAEPERASLEARVEAWL